MKKQLTVARRDKEIVNKGRAAPDGERIYKIEFIIVVVEVQFEVLVREKIAGVGRNASERHDLRPLPKSEQSLLSVESLNYAPQTQISCAGLDMCLQDVSR